jgi:hypothetical protein
MRRASASPVSLPHHSPQSNDVDGRSPQYTPAGKFSAEYNGLGIAAANATDPYIAASAYVDRTSDMAAFGMEEASQPRGRFASEERKIFVPSSASSEPRFEPSIGHLVPQEMYDYYSRMNAAQHSPPAPPAHSAPPVRPTFTTGIPSIAPPSSFSRIDAASGTGGMFVSFVGNRTSSPVFPFTAPPSTGNSSLGTSSSVPASASSTAAPNEAFQNRINRVTLASLGSESPCTVKPEKEEGQCDRAEGRGDATFSGHGEPDVRVEDDAEDEPAYNLEQQVADKEAGVSQLQ